MRFSQAEKDRDQIFAKLESCNKRLKKLLQISEENVDLLQKRAAATNHESNVLCRFWRQASRAFTALSLVLNCNCRPQHSTRLLLEHRTNTPTDFRLLYSKSPEKGQEARRITITEKSTDLDASASIHMSPFGAGAGNMPPHNPKHRDSTPKSSSLKRNTSSSAGNMRYVPLVMLHLVVFRFMLIITQDAGVSHHHTS